MQVSNKQSCISQSQQSVAPSSPFYFARMHLPATTAENGAAELHATNKGTFYYISPSRRKGRAYPCAAALERMNVEFLDAGRSIHLYERRVYGISRQSIWQTTI